MTNIFIFILLLFFIQFVGCGSVVPSQLQSGLDKERSKSDKPSKFSIPENNPVQVSAFLAEDLRKNCTLAIEQSERKQGLLLSSNCYEVGRSPGPAKDYFNAKPGVDNEGILSLSTPSLSAHKTAESATRFDLTLIPRNRQNANFSDFHDFNTQLQKNPEHFIAIFRQFIKIIDLLGLNIHGYRLVIDDKPKDSLSLPFHFRVFAGEPLGSTVQLETSPNRAHNPAIQINDKYDSNNAFVKYINEISSDASYKIHIIGTEKAFTFSEASPKATVHMLAIPKRAYVSSYDFFKGGNSEEIAALFKGVSQTIADNSSKGEGGFRLITDAGFDASQTVGHLHFHVLRGGAVTYPSLGKPAIPAHAHRIFKSYNIYETVAHIDQKTLAAFDVDSTLIWVPGHTWPYPEVTNISLAEGQNTSRMWQELVSRTTNGFAFPSAKYIFLTARSASAPINQELAVAGINILFAWSNVMTLSFDKATLRGFRAGALYAAYVKKSQVLLPFLKQALLLYPFKKIISVDDRWENVLDLATSLKTNKLNLDSGITFWYQGAINPTSNQLIDVIP